ncbi:MAG: nucleoid-associated protein, YbaB/EbfC family [Deltaproteobacteria bacterium RIFCSPLOWO2_02_FULL_53_8]|nr:MAG: nucleoid-associated protein, YbaB/EbfC family [Deltaproteobacteria bacterium RIFCSPLOWO2_02_FULL_53_8]
MSKIANMMRQAQKMQEKIGEIQKELALKTCDAAAGGGMVTATVTGAQEVVSIKIDPSVIDPKDPEMLQDLVVAAVNEGLRRSKQMATDEMSKITAGLGVDIPGLF